MKIHFEDNQQHQLDAIQAVVELFEGQRRLEPAPLFTGEVEEVTFEGITGVYPNRLELSEGDLLANVVCAANVWRSHDARKNIDSSERT